MSEELQSGQDAASLGKGFDIDRHSLISVKVYSVLREWEGVEVTHFQRWLATVLDNMDRELDAKTRERILESCGRSCLSRNFIEKVEGIRKSSANEDEFLQELMKQWKHFHAKDGQFYVVYDHCYCPIVKDYSGKLSPSYCNCSRGWIKELFDTVLQRPVEVALEKSIKRGDEKCQFRVYV